MDITGRTLRPARSDRGPYRHVVDKPPSCPGCGCPVDFGPSQSGLAALCLNPACADFIILFRQAESGSWMVVERVRRAGQASQGTAAIAAAG
jgi:hypothetical protein